MKILLASPRGFCAGVNMAIETLDLSIKLFGTPIYVYHEIVHNRYVVERFKKLGAVFVDHLHEVPVGSQLLFSAHGVSPEIRQIAQDRQLKTIDATCPLVTKVHLEAIKFAKDGYKIVLIGHEGHDEVIGTMGEAPDVFVLVEDTVDVDGLPFDQTTKLAYLTQTTLSVDDANRIIERLKLRFPQIIGPPKEDICYATQNRQEAVRLLAPDCQLVLVLGSQNSSNSQRLAELAREVGVPAHLIDGRADIRDEWFTGVETVLVTAGASAPESVVSETLDYLREKFAATVEERSIREEEVYFPLPRELRVLTKV
ncbi:MAG: 4-hydroxy-3-methylbut-2-enyl diphosphate reductase [Pirellulales bacterium]|nr:4-hydroxy-3-methylbut-2-enyl diphosphate reductase [Pirellulales bacterium]